MTTAGAYASYLQQRFAREYNDTLLQNSAALGRQARGHGGEEAGGSIRRPAAAGAAQKQQPHSGEAYLSPPPHRSA